MLIYYLVVFFIIGICMGSFYNVVGYRLPNGMSLVKPSSHCPNCNHKLKPLELIPVFSYLFLGAKCYACKQKIAVFYPLMELLTGILFALSYFIFGLSYELIIALMIASLFVIIIVSDFKYYIINDEVLIFALLLISVIIGINQGIIELGYSLLNGLIVFASVYLFMLFGNFIFKKDSMGGGDIKLMGLIGVTVGLFNSLIIFVMSAFLALPFAILCLIKDKNHVIPYGPFIALSYLIVYFLQADFLEIILNLY